MDTRSQAPAASSRRATVAAVLAVATGAVLTTLLMTIVYGLTAEYGVTGQPMTATALGALRDWALGMAIAAAPALLAVRLARRTPGGRSITVAAAVVVGVLVVAVPAGAVLGVQEKYQRYESAPVCTDGFSAGPAVPVTRAAQTAYEQIDHPAPFGGGGSSGVDGCSTQLMTREDVDVRAHYRTALPTAGWRVISDDADVLRAVRGRQAFELTRDQDLWWVWIGPSQVEPRRLPDGAVGPYAGG